MANDHAGSASAAQPLADRILDALPQTQCQRCGYADCAAYAHAMAAGEAEINRCPPGGAEGVRRLAALTQRPILPLDPEHGTEGPRSVAWIDESWCIGCTLCIKACPVDCIIGTNKAMHTVVESECTGCELCVAACPVDCIHMENVTGTRSGWDAWSAAQAESARSRYALRQARSAGKATAGARSPAAATQTQPGAAAPGAALSGTHDKQRKHAAVAAALARARARRGTG